MPTDQVFRDSLLSPGATVALVDSWLDRLLPAIETPPEPLHRAMRYAVFSGGKRLRPQLLLQVAHACAIQPAELELALRAACAVELVHTASLVHDDLPCFDDAAARRGRPTVHVLFGEPTAVLVGDALLAHAMEVLAEVPRALAPRALRIVRLLVRATGSRAGLIGGQSLEQEEAHSSPGTAPWCSPELIERYYSMKTGLLFAMTAEAGAVAAGSLKAAAWARAGQLFGRCYQRAYDLTQARRSAASAAPRPAKNAAAAPLGPPNPVLRGGEEEASKELQATLTELGSCVQSLAADPETFHSFLHTLHDHLLQGTDFLKAEPAAAPIGAATPAAPVITAAKATPPRGAKK